MFTLKDKIRPVELLIKGITEVLERGERLLVNHVANEDFSNKGDLQDVIKSGCRKAKDALEGIIIHMKACHNK